MHKWADLLEGWPVDQGGLFNIRPSNNAGTLDAEGFKLRRWSLLPRWAKEPKLKYSTFNARSETLAEKPSYRDAWNRSQRCVVPASAYFEWQAVAGKKQCYRIYDVGEKPLLLGGLWERWGAGDSLIESFTVITTAALPEIAWVHDRTPLLLLPQQLDPWLTGSVEDATEIIENRSGHVLDVALIPSPPKG